MAQTVKITPASGLLEFIGNTTSNKPYLQHDDNGNLTLTLQATKKFTVAGNLKVNGKVTMAQQTLTDGAAITWDFNSGANAKVTLAGARTLVISNMETGDTGLILVKQDAAGSRTLTLPGSSSIVGGGTYTASPAANATDVLGVYYDGTTYWWTIGYNTVTPPLTSVGITGGDFVIANSPLTANGNIGLALATVNSTVGTFGSATAVPVITVNAKGLVTAVSATNISIPTNLDSLTDVTITSAATNQLLQFNGSQWVNWTPNYITSYTETDTLASVTGRGATTNTAVTFNGNVTLGNSADLVFVDLAGTFPTSGKGFDWTLNNDGARIYAIQPGSDSIDLVFQLRDNATTNDRFVFWVDDYQGAAYDKYPLIIRGGTEFDLVDSGLFVRGTQVLTNGRVLQNISGNISMFSNDSAYITNAALAGYATQTYVNTAVSNLVASAPSTLDTLNELATALGNDANFATTITTSIGTKQPQLNGTGFVKVSGTTVSYDNSTYLTTASAASTYVSLTGSYANPSWITSLAYSKITGVPAFLTSYTETDTLASVTGRGATTNTASVFGGGLYARGAQNDGDYSSAALWTESYNNTTTGIAFHISGIVGKFLEMRTDQRLYWDNEQVWHTGNLTNLNQLTNGPGYITGYTETNTFLGDGGSANTHPGTDRIIFTGQLSLGAAVLGMPSTDNSNAILNINRHPGEYNSQLGFSSNGSMYYRSFSATAINNTQAWRQVWDSDNLTNLNQLTNGPAYITTAALSGYATQTYVNTAISNLIDTAPSTLDTLNELAAALGDDPNFATSITTSIGNKVSKSGDTMTGNLAFGATSGLGLTWGLNTDAAFIKFISSGNQAGGSYLEIGTQDDQNEEIKFTQSGVLRFYLATDGYLKTGSGYKYVYENGTWAIDISGNAVTTSQTDFGSLTIGGMPVATEDWVQGQGYITGVSDVWVNTSGDTMTGILRSSYNTATGIANNSFNVAKTIIGNYHIQNGFGTGGNNKQAAITFQGDLSTEAQAGIYVSNNTSTGTAMGFATTDSYTVGPQLFLTASCFGVVNFPRATPTVQGNAVWHAGNDGAGSGLDADLLDGYHASGSVGANTVVIRDVNGYIYGNYINTNVGVDNPSIANFITDSGDGWMRKSSIAHVRSSLGNYGSWLTQAAADPLYVNITGDSMTGPLVITGTTSGQELFAVNGVNGRLFTVSDDLSNSLFSVNTVAGLPVIEAFANNTVNIGPFSAPIVINASGISTPSHGTSANWNSAYNDTITSAAVSGTTSKTLTLTQRDGGTVTATWTDIDTDTNTDQQTLSVNGSTLSISGGNSITLPTSGISQATADGLYVNISGDEMTGNLYISPISANPAQIQLNGSNPELYVSAKTGTARVFINREGTGHQATLMFTTAMNVFQGTAWDYTGAPMWSMGMTNNNNTNSFKIAYGDIYEPTLVALEITTANTAYFKYVPYAAGNLLATQSWVTSQGYITSYSETDTLNSVTGRGASTTNNITIGGLTVGGSLSYGTFAAASNYVTGADNIVLKGNASGVSGIFFESERDGTNINHPSDFGFIQYHAYGIGGSTGEANRFVIGVSNDADDIIVLNPVNSNGLVVRIGASTTEYTVYHSGNIPTWNQNTSGNAATATTAGALTSMNISQFTNNSGYITSYSETDTLYSVTNRGNTTIQDIEFTNGRKGLVGRYDAAQTQAIFAMGSNYTLQDGAASGQIGNLYGLAWSYNPDYGGAGNNPQSIAGLNHQLLLMQNGITTAAMGSGIWTSGNITAANFSGSSSGTNTGDQTNISGNAATATYATSAGNADTVDSLHASDFVRAYTTSAGNIDSDWGQSFKTFDPVPSGTPPLSSPNIRTINIGENYARRTQLAFDYASDVAYFRRRNDSGWQTWREFIHSGNISTQTVATAGALSSMNISQFTNNSGYLTSITSGNVTTALGYTPWHAGNDGAGSGLDADLLDGYTSDAAANVNTIVRRDASGNIYSNYVLGSYFNASAGNSANPTIGQIWTQDTSDNYLRKSTPAHFRSQVIDGYYLPLSGGTITGTLDLSNNNLQGVGHITMSDSGFGEGIQWESWFICDSPDDNSNQTGNLQFVYFPDNSVRMTFDTGGTLTLSNRLVELSSIRYKTNVESLTPALDKVLQLRPVYYTKIGGTGSTEIGLIAEEVAEIYPELIKYNDAGQVDGINYTRIAPILIKTIQEQQELIKKLTERIENLENR